MNCAYTLSHDILTDWINDLIKTFTVLGPIQNKKHQVVFDRIKDCRNIDMGYCSTMLAPRQFIYPSRQTLFKINREEGNYNTDLPEQTSNRLIFAIHPCDMHAISVLDRTFLNGFNDAFYKKMRQETVTVVLNCNKACDSGFCASMGTGPFLQLKDGFDLVLTAKQQNYLIEAGSERGKEIIEKAAGINKALKEDFTEKSSIEANALRTFKKQLDTTGLPQLLMQTLEHPVYKRTADERCLGCTNCTMVCPTCYCYNIEDSTAYDLRTTHRARYWDSCQELHFAQVHDTNFRPSRQARLRQFVTHKLATWVEQYGCFGCIGCGRCMTWCPTNIDLTEMAKEIQQDVHNDNKNI